MLDPILNFFKKQNKPKPTNTSNSSKFDQTRIDQILDKISDSGYDSLTKTEKDYLFKVGKNKK